MSEPALPPIEPPLFDDIVDRFDLDILKVKAGLAAGDGDPAATTDGDVELGDNTFNALYRFVESWRLNEPHLQYLFDMMITMRERGVALKTKMDGVGTLRRKRFDRTQFLAPDPRFVSSLREIFDQQRSAACGFSTYAGCIMTLLSGYLLRFKNDIGAADSDWNKAAPLYHGCSLGRVIVASANGFRHDDEWAKTRKWTPQQQASKKVLKAALPTTLKGHTPAPGRCPEILEMLCNGVDFDRLCKNLFAFAHNVAIRRRTPRRPRHSEPPKSV